MLRKYYMMEMNPIYYSVIVEKWEKLIKKRTRKIQ